MRKAITELTDAGGNLMISGSNIVSDLVIADKSTNFERRFMENTLKIKWKSDKIGNVGQVVFKPVNNIHFQHVQQLSFYSIPNSVSYHVEAPDVILPAGKKAVSLCDYKENGYSAGIAYKEKYGICAFGFPFETIKSADDQNMLMKSVLQFFTDKNIH